MIDALLGQIALTSVFFSMIGGSVLICFNQAIATCLTAARRGESGDLTGVTLRSDEPRVLIGGYGRVGHTIAVMLQDSGIAFVAFDTDLKRVAQGKADGHQVVYGDITDPALKVLRVPVNDIDLMIQEVRDWEYKPVLEEEEAKEP